MPSHSDLDFERVILAVLLSSAFYTVGFSLAGTLFFVGYLEIMTGQLVLSSASWLAGIVAAWSMWIGFDRSVSPGLHLDLDEQQTLFRVTREVASAMGSQPVVEVFLHEEPSIRVTRRGGVHGFGARQVLELGITLLPLLSVVEFRALLANEFARSNPDGSKLESWILQTRTRILRSLDALATAGGLNRFLSIPFKAYGKFFCLITSSSSRRRQILADELTVRIVGREKLISALLTARASMPVFRTFWQNEYFPILDSGFRAPFLEGFERFVSSGSIGQASFDYWKQNPISGNKSSFGLESDFQQRMDLLRNVGVEFSAVDERPGLSVLTNVSLLERRLTASLSGVSHAELKEVEWNSVAVEVYLPQWLFLAKHHAVALGGVTPESLPDWAANEDAFLLRFKENPRNRTSDGRGRGTAEAAVACALTVLLVRKGGLLHFSPGKHLSIACCGVVIKPFLVFNELSSGGLRPKDWWADCARLEIAKADLGALT